MKLTEAQEMRTCTSCKFYRKAGFFSVRGDICENEECDEPAWSYHDPVTGETRRYERRHRVCYLARHASPCGLNGDLWRPVKALEASNAE